MWVGPADVDYYSDDGNHGPADDEQHGTAADQSNEPHKWRMKPCYSFEPPKGINEAGSYSNLNP
jgi:hypothetical protein